jgi:DNA-binding NarL/FixJ family response regulator
MVEDDPRQHEEILQLIRADRRFELVGDYFCGETALEALPALTPDVALVDLGLPRLSGQDLISELKPRMAATQFLVLTAFANPEAVFAALQAGATGYLLKSEPLERITQAAIDITRGEAPMSGAIARRVMAHFEAHPVHSSDLGSLSRREIEILKLLAQGHLYKEIANATGLGLGTVRTYIRRIYEKLHVHNRTEAINKLPRSQYSNPSAGPPLPSSSRPRSLLGKLLGRTKNEGTQPAGGIA